MGFEAARAAGATEVAVFGAASEAFSRKNINCSIAESLERFRPVAAAAREAGIKLRGYVSCVLGCPYEGEVRPQQVAAVAVAVCGMGHVQRSVSDGTRLPTFAWKKKKNGATSMRTRYLHGHWTRPQHSSLTH